MGLDVSHGCYSGSYRWFGIWRNELAKLAGYKIIRPTDARYIEVPDLNYDSFTDKNFEGKWRKPPKDILIVLLSHSDAEGYIYPEHTEPLAKRLRELMGCIDDESATYKIDNRYKRKQIFCTTFQFTLGLDKAAKNKEKVCFS